MPVNCNNEEENEKERNTRHGSKFDNFEGGGGGR